MNTRQRNYPPPPRHPLFKHHAICNAPDSSNEGREVTAEGQRVIETRAKARWSQRVTFEWDPEGIYHPYQRWHLPSRMPQKRATRRDDTNMPEQPSVGEQNREVPQGLEREERGIGPFQA